MSAVEPGLIVHDTAGLPNVTRTVAIAGGAAAAGIAATTASAAMVNVRTSSFKQGPFGASSDARTVVLDPGGFKPSQQA
jgi:hypothetical protein